MVIKISTAISSIEKYEGWRVLQSKHIGKYLIMIREEKNSCYRRQRLMIQSEDGSYLYIGDSNIENEYREIKSLKALDQFLEAKYDYEAADRFNLSLLPEGLMDVKRKHREIVIVYDSAYNIRQCVINRTNVDLVRHFNAFRYGKPKVMPYRLNPDNIVFYNGEIRQYGEYWDGTGTDLLHDYQFYKRLREAVESEGLRIAFIDDWGDGWSSITEGSDDLLSNKRIFDPFDPKSAFCKFSLREKNIDTFNERFNQKINEMKTVMDDFSKEIAELESRNPNELLPIALRLKLTHLKDEISRVSKSKL